MMTNSEAFERINELFNEKMFWDDSMESYNFELTKNFIISALEENDKLKAEIERLKSELEQLSKQYSNVESMYHKYYNLHKKGKV